MMKRKVVTIQASFCQKVPLKVVISSIRSRLNGQQKVGVRLLLRVTG
jgi:hypothetical protein